MNKLKLLRTTSRTILAFALIFSLSLGIARPAFAAISDEDLNAVLNGTEYYAPNFKGKCDNVTTSSSSATPGPLYFLGDSIGTQVAQPLTTALSGKGWTVRANVLSGRNLKGSPPSPDGVTAIDADNAFIKTATAIVIEQGTNTGGLNETGIASAIDKIRELSPNAKIFWVDTAVVQRADYAKALNAVNTAIYSMAVPKGYTVISWNKKVFGDAADPKNMNPNASDNGYIRRSDQFVHLTDSGVTAMTDLISSSLGGPAVVSPSGSASCSCSAGGGAEGPSDFSGSDNQQKTFNFFVSKGLTKAQAAGIVGNAVQESGVNPKSLGRSYSGMFQWDNNGRFANLKNWVTAKGMDPLSLEGQLEFAWYEASQRKNIEGIKKQDQVNLAAWYWGRFFEGAVVGGSSSTTPLTNVQELDKRIKYAEGAFAKYSGESVASSASGGGGSCGGKDSQFLDGFTIYSQYDPAWKDKPYSSSTIGASGCGPSAMAMIITALTKQPVTPLDTATYAASQGMYVPGAGSSWAIASTVANHWGLRAEPVGANLTKITQALQAGGLVITSGKGPKPFTSGGHYIVIRAITASGKLKVGDSAHKDTSDKEWDPQEILSNMAGGSAYAIYTK